MRGAQLAGYRKFDFIEAETAKTRDGQVLIKTERASICGSD